MSENTIAATQVSAIAAQAPVVPTIPAVRPAADSTTFAILVSLSVCHLLNDMNQSLVPAIYPILKESYHLDFGQIGLITLAFQLTASMLQPVVGMITEWMSRSGLEKREAGGDLGGTMRLGAYPASLTGNSVVASIYGTNEISERHRHRYEVNTGYRDVLEKGGLVFSGMSPDGTLPEIVERPDHPWFVGVQFHPELKSKPFDPHPLFASFIEAAVKQSRMV